MARVGYFSSDKDENGSVVAKFDDNGVITIEGWGAWYDGDTYCEDTKTILAPVNAKANSSVAWSVEGTYNTGDELGYTGTATLVAYEDGSYELKGFLPHNNFIFTVENGQMVITSGGSWGDVYEDEDYGLYSYFYYFNGYDAVDDIVVYFDETATLDLDNKTLEFEFGYYPDWNSYDGGIYGTYTFTWEGDGTSISKVTTVADGNAPVYNLSGMKVANSKNLPKGVYISNGKKFVVK